MDTGPQAFRRSGFRPALVRRWFALTRRKIRLLQAGEVTAQGPVLFAVSHPPGFLPALAFATALERPVRCLLPKRLARGFMAGFLAPGLDFILDEGKSPGSEAAAGEALDTLAGGGALAVFADQAPLGLAPDGGSAATAAALVGRAEAQRAGRRVAIHPVHLYQPERGVASREILIYVDSPLARLKPQGPAPSDESVTQDLAAAMESRFRENAFQLLPVDLECFLNDLTEILRSGLHEEWASQPEWKQDVEGFSLSGMTSRWVEQANYLHPARLIHLRQSLEDYRRLERDCALRELEVGQAGAALRSVWRRAVLWAEALVGLPLAVYGLVNHLATVLLIAGADSLRKDKRHAGANEWILRAAVTVAFYVAQTYAMAHWRGRVYAGYYAPSLPISGLYLWRYWRLVGPQARLLLKSLTIPGLRKKINLIRRDLLESLDRTSKLEEEKASTAR